MSSQRCPYPKHWISLLCYITGQGGWGGIKVADGIKVAIDFEMRGHPRLSGLAQGNNKGPSKWKKEWEEWVSVQCDVRKTCLAIAGFEDGHAHEPGNAGSSQHWKRQDNILS